MWAQAETRTGNDYIKSLSHFISTKEYPSYIPRHPNETGALVIKNRDGGINTILRRIIN